MFYNMHKTNVPTMINKSAVSKMDQIITEYDQDSSLIIDEMLV